MTSMKKSIVPVFMVLFMTAGLLSGCVPRDKDDKNVSRFPAQNLIDTINQKIKDGTLKDSVPPEVTSALTEVIRTGNINRFLPPTSVILFGILIPILTVVGFFAFLIIFIKLYHMRSMALIDKGQYERKPLNIKWELFFLFIGLILAFVGPAISIYMVSLYGLQSWTIFAGIVPLFLGLAFLIFYKVYINMKKNISA